MFPRSAQAADYQLGSMDKLHIRVVEWQTAEGAVRDWPTISGDYIVGPSGSISLPFIGEMPAAGKTTAEIAAAIGDGLQQKFGLPDRPDASVELAEFRPVFVSGDVQTPGKYPYDPQSDGAESRQPRRRIAPLPKWRGGAIAISSRRRATTTCWWRSATAFSRGAPG